MVNSDNSKNIRNAKKRRNIENRKQEFTLEQLEQIKKDQQVLDMLVESVDDSFNMIGVVGDNIKSIIPREEASSIVLDNGLVDERHIVNKVNKRVQVCIKDIIVNPDNTVELILSKKILELKVRKWMYMHLKPGMKLRGVVRNITDYAAFVDVGGGVFGILKLPDICDIPVNNVSDILKPGQRIEVLVKKYDRDTGRIELSYKEFLGTFEDNIKKISEGDIIEGIVRNRTKTGVFVELKPNLVGLADHVNGIEYGQKVLVSIKRIVPEKKKIKIVIIG
ncbi:MAG: S1 RNA-binding domain-containing protein [Clostridia bacterium]|nr:S1 RNA-binding domain-containing protein [Clostridia bacterium]